MNETASTPTIVTPEQGFHRLVPFDDYARWEAINSHMLNGLSKTPAHALYDLQHGGKERTKSLDLGWLFHVAVLEPSLFETEFVVAPKIDRRTKAGKQTWLEFIAEHPAAQAVDAETMEKVISMREELFAHPTAGPFFSGQGHNEVSILWQDREHDMRCKARLDRVGLINEWPVIGELKSARDASRRSFERSIVNYGYHISAYHYLAGLEVLQPRPQGHPQRRYIFFVVESEPPYCVACYDLDDSALAEAEIVRRRYMTTLKRCMSNGVWPGYPDGIEYVSLPAWAFKNWVDD
jgi:exodeoxyribonuclease VIII